MHRVHGAFSEVLTLLLYMEILYILVYWTAFQMEHGCGLVHKILLGGIPDNAEVIHRQ